MLRKPGTLHLAGPTNISGHEPITVVVAGSIIHQYPQVQLDAPMTSNFEPDNDSSHWASIYAFSRKTVGFFSLAAVCTSGQPRNVVKECTITEAAAHLVFMLEKHESRV